MDHTEAVQKQAVDRYLLGEMPDSEAESFEKHFFECSLCTGELESGAIFAENLRAMSSETQPAVTAAPQPSARSTKWSRFREWWRQPLLVAPAFATAVLAGIVIYQAGFVIPALRTQAVEATRPQALLVFALKPATRGEITRVTVPAGLRFFSLDIDLVENAYRGYRCDLYDGSGNVRFSLNCPPPPAGNPLRIMIPVRGLRSAVYTLKVLGRNGAAAWAVIVQSSFLLQLQ